MSDRLRKSAKGEEQKSGKGKADFFHSCLFGGTGVKVKRKIETVPIKILSSAQQASLFGFTYYNIGFVISNVRILDLPSASAYIDRVPDKGL